MRTHRTYRTHQNHLPHPQHPKGARNHRGLRRSFLVAAVATGVWALGCAAGNAAEPTVPAPDTTGGSHPAATVAPGGIPDTLRNTVHGVTQRAVATVGNTLTTVEAALFPVHPTGHGGAQPAPRDAAGSARYHLDGAAGTAGAAGAAGAGTTTSPAGATSASATTVLFGIADGLPAGHPDRGVLRHGTAVVSHVVHHAAGTVVGHHPRGLPEHPGPTPSRHRPAGAGSPSAGCGVTGAVTTVQAAGSAAGGVTAVAGAGAQGVTAAASGGAQVSVAGAAVGAGAGVAGHLPGGTVLAPDAAPTVTALTSGDVQDAAGQATSDVRSSGSSLHAGLGAHAYLPVPSAQRPVVAVAGGGVSGN